jgi:hypothetical protein
LRYGVTGHLAGNAGAVEAGNRNRPTASTKWSRRSDLQKRVAEEKPDSLRLLVEVGGQGAFVAAFRNRAEIVLASPQSSICEVRGAGARAAPAFAQPMSAWCLKA